MGYYEQERSDPHDYKLKKGRFSKLMVVAVAIALLAFTAATFIVSMTGNYVPDSLVYCFFGAALGEFWALAVVKKTKTERDETDADYREYREQDCRQADPETDGDERGSAEAGSADAEQQTRLRV